MRIFENLSFALSKGQCLELRGPNGAGKSSLLRMLAGFIEPAGGELHFADRGENRRLSHYVGHADAIKLALTVRENLAFWSGLSCGDIDRALPAFSLQSLVDEPAQLLSQGQRRRLALTRLILSQRPVWLLDEPANGLDTASLEKLRTQMMAHLESGGGIIAATHVDLGLPGTETLRLAGRA